jgi:cysteinyl-tRNA synthetase
LFVFGCEEHDLRHHIRNAAKTEKEAETIAKTIYEKMVFHFGEIFSKLHVLDIQLQTNNTAKIQKQVQNIVKLNLKNQTFYYFSGLTFSKKIFAYFSLFYGQLPKSPHFSNF